ncbi:MAG: glycosyltransferase [Bacteroidales bacterium]|nr:glycosyltransferase [Bacteroidales bacterium]
MASEKEIKVLVIPSWYPPNGGYFFREHAIALAEAGARVNVLAGIHTSLRTLRPADFFKSRTRHCISSEGITEHLRKYWIKPFSNKPNFHGWVNMMLRFYKSHQKLYGKPDIILAHSSIWAGLVAAFIREKYGVPYVITEHRSRFIYNSEEAMRMFEPWFFPYLQTAFEGAENVITVSDALQPFIKQIAPGAAERMISIPNMVDTDFFVPPSQPLPQKPFTFFSLANLIPLKGMDTLIEAFALLLSRQKADFRLVIGGDGLERGKLEQLAERRNLHNKITFVGKLDREQVAAYLQQAHAFVLASHFEAFGVVYIEAMASGLPVIATRAGGPESFIRESEGLLVEPQNPETLAIAMEKLFENYHAYDPAAIRQHATAEFGRESVARQYIELFKEIIKKQTR